MLYISEMRNSDSPGWTVWSTPPSTGVPLPVVGGVVVPGAVGAGVAGAGAVVPPAGPSTPGMVSDCPAMIRFGLTMLLAWTMASTVTPYCSAMRERESPGWMTWVVSARATRAAENSASVRAKSIRRGFIRLIIFIFLWLWPNT